MKKTFKKRVLLVIAMVMALAMGTMVYAASKTIDSEKGGNASITVTLPTYTAAEIAAGATNKNTYKIYKVFDATVSTDGKGISYTLVNGKTTAPAGFTADANGYVTYTGTGKDGELTAADIAAIKSYIGNSDLVITVETDNNESFTVTGLEYGYYFIDTTVGTLVTVNSTNPNASVEDKNEIPPLDKKITGASSVDAAGKKAIEEVGKNVEYTVKTKILKGAENYIFYDLMDAGLAYNKDVKVYTTDPASDNATELTTGWTTDDTAVAGQYTFKVTFANEYVAAHEDQDLWIKYTAKVTKEALTTEPLKNTAHLDFGHTPGLHHTPYSSTETYGAKIVVLKKEEVSQDTEGAVYDETTKKYYKPLAGAGFVLKNADGKYYQYHAATDDADAHISWVDDIANATEYTSGNDGKLSGEFIGLAAGTYTLEEKTVPASYTKADDIDVTIRPANDKNEDGKVFTADNLIQERQIENKQGSVLPSTGGMGTTIFYVIGGLLILAAAIVLISRRKVQQ